VFILVQTKRITKLVYLMFSKHDVCHKIILVGNSTVIHLLHTGKRKIGHTIL